MRKPPTRIAENDNDEGLYNLLYFDSLYWIFCERQLKLCNEDVSCNVCWCNTLGTDFCISESPLVSPDELGEQPQVGA